MIRLSLLICLLALALPATSQADFQSLGRLPDSGQDAKAPQVAVAPNGAATYVWAHYDGTSAEFPDPAIDPRACCYRIETRTRATNGTLSAVQSLSLGKQNATQPDVAVDQNGNAYFTWVTNNGTNDLVQTRTRNASTGALSALQVLSAAGQNSDEPHVAVDPNGNATYVWERQDGSSASCCFRAQVRRRAVSGTLSATQTLSAAGQIAFSPQVAVDSAGNAVLVWAAFNGTKDEIQVVRRVPAGTLSAVQVISTANKESTQPQVALRPSTGDAVFTWIEVGSVDTVMGRTRTSGGTLGTIQTISDTGQYSEEPQVAMDVNGNAIFIFERFDGTQPSANPPCCWRIRTRTLSVSGVLGTTEEHSAAGQTALAPQIAFDSTGNAVFTWGRFDGTNPTAKCCFLIQVRRRTSSGSLSTVQTLSVAGQNAAEPQIGSDSNGNGVVVWSRSDGKYKRIQTRVRAVAGTLSALQILSTVGPDAFTPQLALDPNGNAIFTWMAFDGAHNSIQARNRTAGVLGTNSQTISDTTQNSSQPQIGADSLGNSLLVWKRFDASSGTCCNRIQDRTRTAAGVLGAVETLSPAGQNADTPQVAVNQNGNAVLVWMRSDGTNTRIEAVARSSTGTLSAVQTLSAAGQNADSPQVGIDSAGNAVFTWKRSDGTNTRIEGVTRSAAGTFGTVQLLSVAGQNASEPQVAVDPNGDAVFTWKRSDGTNTRIESFASSTGSLTSLAAQHSSSSTGTAAVDPCQGVALWPGATNGNDTVNGTAGNDVIFTGDGNDTINGLGGNDTLCGGNGADTLDGGAGADYLSGAAGEDTATYGSQTTPVTVTIDGVADDGNANDGPAGARDNVQTDVENLKGGSGADTLTGSAADNTLDGGNGADVLNGLGGDDTATYASRSVAVTADIDGVADDGNSSDGPVGARDNVKTDIENLRGGAAADTLTGSAADNTLDGGKGADVMSGLAGTDTATYESRTVGVTVTIDGVANDGDASDGPVGARDNVQTDIENLKGGAGADTLTGSTADNTINGERGADVMSGLAGNDTVTYADRTTPVTVTIDGVANDGGSTDGPVGARDNVLTDIENLTGGTGADTLTGNVADNRLTGGPGADALQGGDGNDTLLAKDNTTDTLLDCGTGTSDTANVDPKDPATVGCESITSVVDIISEPGQNASQAQVAVDPNGNATFAWTRFDGTEFRVQSRGRSSAGTLSPIQIVSPAGASSGIPQLAVDSSGKSVIVWRFDGANKRVEARTRLADGTLDAVQFLSIAGYNADLPQIAVSPTGTALATWQLFDGKKSRVEGAFGP